jgi:hypothetical protein
MTNRVYNIVVNNTSACLLYGVANLPLPRSVIKVSELLGNLGSVHPHDAHFLPNGDIVVATWRPGHITYWKKL